MTHVSISIFQGLIRNIDFIYVALVTKKLWAILYFLSKDRNFTQPYALKNKKILLITIKSHKISRRKCQQREC